uniref:RING-type domain-containing protein n=2 Tax=Brassica oleracea var. oleracea TaxID=109376 RepID=A0A0D3DWM7_BRAOL
RRKIKDKHTFRLLKRREIGLLEKKRAWREYKQTNTYRIQIRGRTSVHDSLFVTYHNPQFSCVDLIYSSMSNEVSHPAFTLFGLDDVENYGLVSEADNSLPLDIHNQVFQLVEKGNEAFKESHRFEEAISNYSKANSVKPLAPVVLTNRSAAYIRFGQYLKQRSASISEYRPLNGFDMSMLGELALKDADKVMNIKSTSVKSYITKACALMLLERYEAARDTILSGLQIDPFSDPLRSNLQELDKVMMPTSTRKTHGNAERSDDFDCTVCLKLLYEPATTPCGHTFCRSCLFQSMDRGNKCPLCRTVIFMTPRTCAVSVTLNNIIQKNFPEEYAERKSEQDTLVHLGNESMPLFVMDVIVPCQKLSLHIFEPRYRLMVRRIMEGNHRMGMVALDSATGSPVDVACEVEITECDPLPDGRFILELESHRRCRIIKAWDQDGYRVAEVEWVTDIPPQSDQEKADLRELTTSAASFARAWLERAKEAARHGDRRRLETLVIVESMIPTPQDPERFSFWLATLTDRRPSERLELLGLQDTGERIRRGLIYLRSVERGCRMQ